MCTAASAVLFNSCLLISQPRGLRRTRSRDVRGASSKANGKSARHPTGRRADVGRIGGMIPSPEGVEPVGRLNPLRVGHLHPPPLRDDGPGAWRVRFSPGSRPPLAALPEIPPTKEPQAGRGAGRRPPPGGPPGWEKMSTPTPHNPPPPPPKYTPLPN